MTRYTAQRILAQQRFCEARLRKAMLAWEAYLLELAAHIASLDGDNTHG